MLWKSESEIREIVRDEIRRVLNILPDSRLKRIYDEDGQLVESEYTYFEEEGHIVNFITRHQGSNMQFYVGHSRTQDNWERVRGSSLDVESVDRKFNEEKVFGKNGPVPAGFKSSSSGLIIPAEKAGRTGKL
jgi:hypothetical protein